jgi:hypothetical protein
LRFSRSAAHLEASKGKAKNSSTLKELVQHIWIRPVGIRVEISSWKTLNVTELLADKHEAMIAFLCEYSIQFTRIRKKFFESIEDLKN